MLPYTSIKTYLPKKENKEYEHSVSYKLSFYLLKRENRIAYNTYLFPSSEFFTPPRPRKHFFFRRILAGYSYFPFFRLIFGTFSFVPSNFNTSLFEERFVLTFSRPLIVQFRTRLAGIFFWQFLSNFYKNLDNIEMEFWRGDERTKKFCSCCVNDEYT